jgi:hypothetical protein
VRLPPALAASVTPRILELLGLPPGRVLELDFAGIHAEPLRLAGFEVLTAVPTGLFDAAVAPADTDLSGVSARKVVLVGQDGSAWSSDSS